MNGIIIIDKPSGMTSHDVVDRVRRLSGAKKVGHGGTLDPLATGVLPILVGSATKLSREVMEGEKEYEVGLRFGSATDTDDAEGKVIKESPVPFDLLERIKAALPRFKGEIEQIPPAYSAIKIGGTPAYKRARKGDAPVLQPRRITIHEIEFIAPSHKTDSASHKTDSVVFLRVNCSKGTYIRALTRDLGAAVGCPAHVESLRRTRCGRFRIDNAHPLEKLSTLQDLIRVLGTPQLL